MKNIISVKYSRKRQKRTDYRKRLKLIKKGVERLVIRKTSNQIIVQFVRFLGTGDQVTAMASSINLKKEGWALGTKNIPAAYMTGLLAGKLARGKGVEEAVLDTGSSKPESRGRVYAALKGAIDAGIKMNASDSIFPSEDRISGAHLKNKEAKKIFEETKSKIKG